MRLVHLLFNYPLLLLIIIMDSVLTTGDRPVSRQWDFKNHRAAHRWGERVDTETP